MAQPMITPIQALEKIRQYEEIADRYGTEARDYTPKPIYCKVCGGNIFAAAICQRAFDGRHIIRSGAAYYFEDFTAAKSAMQAVTFVDGNAKAEIIEENGGAVLYVTKKE